MNLKSVFSFGSIEKKLQKYIDLKNQFEVCKSQADELAEDNFKFTKEYEQAIKSEENKEVLGKIEEKYNNFLKAHIENISKLKRNRNILLKSIAELEGDKKVSLLIEEYKQKQVFGKVKELYKSNKLSTDVYNKIIKAKKEIVEYSDVIVYNDEGKFLTLKRKSESDFEPNKWGLPGGHIDYGEESYEAAERELQEETGIKCGKTLEKIGVFEDKDIKICYYALYLNKTPEVLLESGEHCDYKWVYWEEFEGLSVIKNLKDNLEKIAFPFKRAVKVIKKSVEDGFFDRDKVIDFLEKARSGRYKDTPQNRKKGIVGMEYQRFPNVKFEKSEEPNPFKQYNDIEKAEKIPGGKAAGKTLKDVVDKYNISTEEAEKICKEGTEHELEHTSDKEIAYEIARDHIWEDKDYYTKLKKMEKSLTAITKAYNEGKISQDILIKATKVYVDNAKNRKLKRVGEPYGSNKGKTPSEKKEGEKQPENDKKEYSENELTEHAKNASEADLQNTIKTSEDSKLREAAHKELDRRQKEEHIQEEKQVENDTPKKENQGKVPKSEKIDKEQVSQDSSGEKQKDKKEESRKSTKRDFKKEIKDIENKIKEERGREIDPMVDDYLDQIVESGEKVTQLLKDRERIADEELSYRKVGQEEYISGFKDFSQSKPLEITSFYEEGINSIESTKEEKSAIGFYTREGFEDIRKFLTNPDEFNKENTEEYVNAVNSGIKDLSSFISKNKIQNDISLNRRIRGKGVLYFESLEEGDIYQDASFSSSSLKELRHFGGYNIQILAKKGSSVANIDNKGEYEFLIDKGSEFRIISKYEDGLIVELL